MLRAAALTHVRQDDFFLQLWLDHYSGIVGRENCFVILDGDDWESEVDLSGVNTTVNTQRFFRRIKHDAWLSQVQRRVLAEILETRDFVFRGDCDELVVMDPSSPKSWDGVYSEMKEHGYLYCAGVDMVQHRGRGEVSLDREGPILQQRRHGILISSYFKPNLMSAALPLKAGGHGVKEKPVIVSEDVFMFHLGNIDYEMSANRHQSRTSHFQEHYEGRLKIFDDVMNASINADFDNAMRIVRDQISGRVAGNPAIGRPKKFRNGNIQVGRHSGELTLIPDRFAGLF